MPGMPSLYQIKPAFQRLLTPVLDWCLTKGVSANALTGAALLLSAVAGALVLLTHGAGWVLLLYPVIILVRMALNALDGLVARRTGTSSKGGMIFNEAADLASDAVMYLPLIVVPGLSPLAVVAFTLSGFVAEGAGLLRLARDGQRAYHGPLGKSDRAAAIGIIAVLSVAFPASAIGSWLLWLLVVLHLVTAGNRLTARLEPVPGA
jgi:CDP-diacylglycerol---glycerol-3-phosphate 3-phosphatidyltransferase